MDGRYINSHEGMVLGEKFSDHPTADIIVRNQTYTDSNGETSTGDIVYEYDSATKTWRAPYYYSGGWWYSSNMELPDEFILTAAEVKTIVK